MRHPVETTAVFRPSVFPWLQQRMSNTAPFARDACAATGIEASIFRCYSTKRASNRDTGKK
jgi:hypothetical protein